MHSIDLEAIARTLQGAGASVTVRAPSGARVDTVLSDLSAEVELQQRLGAGGMGEVFLGRQRSLQRLVALKRPHDAQGANALVAEAQLSGALEHPHIVPVHALGRGDDGRPLLMMKRVEGHTLQKLIDEPSHPLWQALVTRSGDRVAAIAEVLSRVADALQFAHERGVIHRDLKPENVMIGAHGEVYLLDFGVALDDVGRQLPPAMVGTPAFMAPELLSGDPKQVDARTDVFLLGATLHAALTGTHRHAGKSLLAVLTSAATCAPVVYGREVPEGLAALCNRATALDPKARPATAAQFRDELAIAMRQRGSVALARELEARLDGLGRASTGAEWSEPAAWELLLECRFGLSRALAEHPQNEVARTTLRRVQRAMIEAHLHRGDVDSAQTVLASLSPADPGLAARIDDAKKRRSESHAFEVFGRNEAKERDLRPARAGIVALVAGVTVAGAVMYSSLATSDSIQMNVVLRFDLLVLAVLGLLLAIFRKRLHATRIGRGITATLFLSLGATTLVDAIGAIEGLPPSQVVPFTLVPLALGMSVAGLHYGRLFYGSAAIVVAGAGSALIWPQHIGAVMPTTVLLANLLAGWEILRQSRPDARP
jgi:serine/threonine-protein kinase